jgi:uncharacterized surface protein with fasciclin (FAS1) repeats
MMTTTRTRTFSALALAGALGLGLGACGGSDTASDTASSTTSSSSSSSSMASPSASMTSSTAMAASTDPIGPGCADYASKVPSGAGSVGGMAQANVTTAASNNPLLTTLTAAVSGKLNPDVNLVDTLNGGQFTVFAPVDSAFAKLPADTVATLKTPAGAKTLTSVLTYHVVAGKMDPQQLISAGTVPTVEGGSVKVAGTPDAMTIDGTTNVICGNVQTANATVYLVDSVLMPPM